MNRLKEETGVMINIPDERSSTIRIEGTPDGVSQAKAELLEMVTKMENEREKDILIEHRFHKNFIGTKGEKIREIRELFHQVICLHLHYCSICTTAFVLFAYRLPYIFFISYPLERCKSLSLTLRRKAMLSRSVAQNKMSMLLTSICKSSTRNCSNHHIRSR